MGTPPSTILGLGFSFLFIILLHPAILPSGAQSVIANRNTRYSNGSDEYKGVQQQSITKY